MPEVSRTTELLDERTLDGITADLLNLKDEVLNMI
jgi:hypothetical protein